MLATRRASTVRKAKLQARHQGGVFAPPARNCACRPTEALKRVFFQASGQRSQVATHGQKPVQNVPPEVRRMFNAPAFVLTETACGARHRAQAIVSDYRGHRGRTGAPNWKELQAGVARSIMARWRYGRTIRALREMRVELSLRLPRTVHLAGGLIRPGWPGTG
jgi:transitional endoplasmic reticulum ATPase